MSFRFIHTADIHLDSPLKSLALRDRDLAKLIGTATRDVFTGIVDLCISEAVDALLIAGDLYDGDQTSMKTARFLSQQLQRLDAAGVRTYIIRGNHDALSKITREMVFPPSVTVFGARAEVHVTQNSGRTIAIHGISFAKPHAADSLLDRFKPPIADAINIGMLHTSLAGAPGHDNYAPCSIADLQATGFDYWALGHVHIRSEIAGRTTIVMPGMPQGRDIGEAGEKSVTLVTVADDGTLTTQMRNTGLARFERVEIGLDGIDHWPDLVAALAQALRTARRDHSAEHLVLRPMLVGATPLMWHLRRDLDLLREEAVAVAESLGTVWIDKIENLCVDQAKGPRATGPLADLEALIGTDILDSPAVAADIEKATEEVMRQLPKELRGLLGEDAATVALAQRALLAEGAAEVLAQLHTSAGDDA
ncbi:metallophosphoesterase family protein [Pseudogemmobacter sp. W21_MBD1_M6]|uniref:metallophosphoesterase family protein n=1 Tax=Pseudogemmobacter sp. W21_MBD1_M6 TaxID=3240271 RepID=UPI003F9A81F0